MKLATALSERADLKRKISELSVRLNNNAKVQEGETPAEDPSELLKELDDCFVRMEELIARINRTNNETRYRGQSIADLIAKRDCLKPAIPKRKSKFSARSPCRSCRKRSTPVRGSFAKRTSRSRA